MKLVKLSLLTAMLAFSAGTGFGQTPDHGAEASLKSLPGFSYNLRDQKLSKNQLEQKLNQMLGLNENHSFSVVNTKTDELGFSHIVYQQYYKGIPVDGYRVLMHVRDGVVTALNGRVAQIDNLSTAHSGDEKSAQVSAQRALGVTDLLQSYPAELVIIPDGSEYHLVYKVRIDGYTGTKGMTQSPQVVMKNVFVDAHTGAVIHQASLIAHADVNAQAKTLYSGTQTITADSYNGAYRLRDNARNIETYNATGLFPTNNPNNVNPFDTLIDYYNATTTWDEVSFLDNIQLSVADSQFMSGLGANAALLAVVGLGDINDLDNLSPLSTNLLYATTLPVNSSGLYVSLPDTTGVGGFLKINGAGDLIDTVLFNMPDTSIGVHTWSDGNGNSGDYSIVLAKNFALDAHWGMEKTHDFFLQNFNRNSFDGNGSVARNYMNGVIYFVGNQINAVALPAPYNSLVYGTGDGQITGPVVGLDVAGHEFTHMVTAHNGLGGLNYEGESGALNESFSDMLATAIEFFVRGDSANWTIGEDVALIAPGYFRSLSEPKALAGNPYFPAQPNTYKGEYWHPTNQTSDNGGVHVNSGVPNKWFYLLAQGGEGVNDNQYQYDIQGIGIEKAQQVAYRTLTQYLTPTATFEDAYNGSLLAAADLFGNNSTEYQTVEKSWRAVGVPNNDETDIVSVDEAARYFDVYPNPADDYVIIQSSWNANITATLYTITGVKIKDFVIKPGKKQVSVSDLSSGTYLIRFHLADQPYTQKITID